MSNAILAMKDRLSAVATVPALQLNVRRHCENLETLAKTLRSLGMDDQEIDRNVIQVFEEYEGELLRTVGQMLKGAEQ